MPAGFRGNAGPLDCGPGAGSGSRRGHATAAPGRQHWAHATPVPAVKVLTLRHAPPGAPPGPPPGCWAPRQRAARGGAAVGAPGGAGLHGSPGGAASQVAPRRPPGPTLARPPSTPPPHPSQHIPSPCSWLLAPRRARAPCAPPLRPAGERGAAGRINWTMCQHCDAFAAPRRRCGAPGRPGRNADPPSHPVALPLAAPWPCAPAATCGCPVAMPPRTWTAGACAHGGVRKTRVAGRSTRARPRSVRARDGRERTVARTCRSS
jgi:hypothetical protein